MVTRIMRWIYEASVFLGCVLIAIWPFIMLWIILVCGFLVAYCTESLMAVKR